MGRFTAENAAYSDAKRALEENLDLLDPEKHKAARNLTIALAYILRTQCHIASDVERLHNKLQPVLKYLEEENGDWRFRGSRYEEG